MGHRNDTIAAIATGQGGAIAVIRLSGGDAIAIADRVFRSRSGKPLSDAHGYTVHFGEIIAPCSLPSEFPSRGGVARSAGVVLTDGCEEQSHQSGFSPNEVIDEVLVTVFRAPNSYTGENSVEVSYHGSAYIGRRIMELLIDAGARAAEPGEFTVRAFLAGKLDLSQAEAVADLIASSGRAQHALALSQMRGGYSSGLSSLRNELVALAALLELELDFSEEDVEFADRSRLSELSERIAAELERLTGSFSLGNAIKEGVPVAIVGRPNAGKSTLLNALVKDDRAMVSDIAGTTRDRIEEVANIGGVAYRFIDTAGLRATDDTLERMGIDRTIDAVRKAHIVLLVFDGGNGRSELCDEKHYFEADISKQIAELDLRPDQKLCVVINKIDVASLPSVKTDGRGMSYLSPGFSPNEMIAISARTGKNLDLLTEWLRKSIDTESLYAGSPVVSNVRHYEALTRGREAIEKVSAGLSSGISSDLLAEDVREALHYIGAITGEVSADEILGTIFSKFCIGK